MTLTKNYKEYEINGETYFVERYADKPDFVWFWRYGCFVETRWGRMAMTLSDMLLTRPNLKKLFG